MSMWIEIAESVLCGAVGGLLGWGAAKAVIAFRHRSPKVDPPAWAQGVTIKCHHDPEKEEVKIGVSVNDGPERIVSMEELEMWVPTAAAEVRQAMDEHGVERIARPIDKTVN